jgi:ATP-dependent Lhr-like helicase
MEETVPAASAAHSALAAFHPAVRAWFERTFGEPSECQAAGWPAIHARRHTLIAAPTGSGKTLAAFLAGFRRACPTRCRCSTSRP